MACKQIDHHAVVARVEVLHDDESHAVGRRKGVQKLPASVQAASRGANRHDRKICMTTGGKGLPNPTRPLRHRLMRTTSTHSASFSRGPRPKRTSLPWLSHSARNDDGTCLEHAG